LKQCFPVLFSIVRNKDVMVVDNLVVHNGVIQWNVLFTRQIQDEEGDRLVRNPFKRSFFEVRSYYGVLIKKNGPSFP